MSNPTTPFNWQMPTNTDLVTDLPADFEVFGQAVATSMADLLGGTTGQILAKNSNTDMDFVWIANDQGDITGVTATSPLTGGGTSGAITVGIQSASTTQSGAVQLTDSTSSTSTTTAATPNSVKTAFDTATTANTTANAAIPKSTVTTAGDVIYATGSSVVTRLGIGSTGQVLTVTGGIPAWATPAGGGGMTLLSTTTLSGTTTSITGISGSYTDLVVDWYGVTNSSNTDASINPNGSTTITDLIRGGATLQQLNDGQLRINNNVAGPGASNSDNAMRLVIANYAATTSGGKPFDLYGGYIGSDSSKQIMQAKGRIKTTSAITQLDFVAGAAFTAGTVKIYGRK